jgi:CxxC-x17-CxxC domain-containing protein
MVNEAIPFDCPNCGNTFHLTASDLEFLAVRGLDGHKSICPECRAKLRASYVNWNSGRGQGRQGREMHTTACAECGIETRVPFIPREGRPVYCPGCFEKHRAASRPDVGAS